MTTTQIANIRKAIDGDVALLDGYETLSDLDQQRISKAFEEGHIADADCFSVVRAIGTLLFLTRSAFRVSASLQEAVDQSRAHTGLLKRSLST